MLSTTRSTPTVHGRIQHRLAACGLVLSLAFGAPSPVLADDDLTTSIRILASVAGRIRAISENCRVAVDPMLEAPMMEALATVPDVSVNDVAKLIIQSREMELNARGRECLGAPDVQQLETLRNIYEMSVEDLKDLVAARQD